MRNLGLAEGYIMPSARPDLRIRIRHWIPWMEDRHIKDKLHSRTQHRKIADVHTYLP